jgi:hypothetical protein
VAAWAGKARSAGTSQSSRKYNESVLLSMIYFAWQLIKLPINEFENHCQTSTSGALSYRL